MTGLAGPPADGTVTGNPSRGRRSRDARNKPRGLFRANTLDITEGYLMAVKTWFITGTSRGFGRDWAIAALDRGNQVAAR
jgi:hypothetical protein